MNDKLRNIGIDFSDFIDKFLTEIKTQVPEIWNEISDIPSEFVSGIKKGYQEGEATKKGEDFPKESAIMRFENFRSK